MTQPIPPGTPDLGDVPALVEQANLGPAPDPAFCIRCGHACAHTSPHPLVETPDGPVCKDVAWCAQLQYADEALRNELRVCYGEDHGREADGTEVRYCCTDDHVVQPDGNAVHRNDVAHYTALNGGTR